MFYQETENWQLLIKFGAKITENGDRKKETDKKLLRFKKLLALTPILRYL